MGYKNAQDDIMTAHSRLIKAVDTLNDALGFEVIQDVSASEQGRVYKIYMSKDWFFSVDFEEIRHNSTQGLVNLLKIRLLYALEVMHCHTMNLGTYVHICRGTQPWVLVEGL